MDIRRVLLLIQTLNQAVMVEGVMVVTVIQIPRPLLEQSTLAEEVVVETIIHLLLSLPPQVVLE